MSTTSSTEWTRRPTACSRIVAALVVAATLACAVPYFIDYYTAYPTRAAAAFEAGEGAGIVEAWDVVQAGRHRLFLSAALNQPLIQLQFAIEASPPQPRFVEDGRITVVTLEAQLDSARPGDIGVFKPGDEVPAGSTLLFIVRGGRVVDAPVTVSHHDLLRVYRLA